MANSLGRLVVSLGLDTAEFTGGLTKSQYEAKRFTDGLKNTLSTASTLIAGASVGAAGALALLTKSAIDSADTLRDLSKSSGVAVETLGGIGFAAGQAGSNVVEATASLGKLNLKIAEAASGNKEAVALFKSFGISVKDASGAVKSADVIFGELATKFAGYAEGPEKAALGNAVFGKSYQAILPLLADGGRALQENIDYYKRYSGVTQETADRADQFNDTLGKLDLLSKSFGNTLASKLLPTLQGVADGILEAREQSTLFETAASAVDAVLKALVITATAVATVFEGVGDMLGANAAALAALVQGDLKGATAIANAYTEADAKRRETLNNFANRVLQGGTARGASRLAAAAGINDIGSPQERAPGVPGTGTAAKQRQSDAERYLESLQRQLDGTKDLSAVEQVLLDIQRGRLDSATNAQGLAIIGLAEQIDGTKELTKQTQAFEAEIQRLAASQKAQAIEAANLFEATRTPLERYEIQIERLNELKFDKAINWETYARAVAQAQDVLTATTDEGKKAISSLDEFTLQAARNIQDQLGQSLYDAATGNFKNIGTAFSQLLLRMTTEAVAADLSKKLFGETGKDGKGLNGGLLGSIANLFGNRQGSDPNGFNGTQNNPSAFVSGGGGGASGGYVSAIASLFAGFFADGGFIPPGRVGVVGERGPELSFGGRTGKTIQPMGSFGGNITINVPESTSRTSAQQIAARTAEAVNRSMARKR